MSTESNYEDFRTVLTMNMCTVTQDPLLLKDILSMVDMTMMDFEIVRKSMAIIPTTGVPDIVNYYLGARSLAGLSAKTLKQYNYKLINFFTTVNKAYSDVTSNDIRNYINMYKIEHKSSNRYLDNIRITLNSFFQWVVDKGYLTVNPCKNVDKINYHEIPRQPLTPLELETVRFDTVNIREKALIDFFFSTGLRASECADVRLSDINWEKRMVHVRHGKGDKERYVFFNAEAEVSMKEYLKTRSDNTDALFVSVKAPHQQIQSKALENIITKVSKRSGIHFYPHKLRHTFATEGLHSGVPLETLQLLMGHKKIETTLIYAKQDQNDVQAVYRRAYA